MEAFRDLSVDHAAGSQCVPLASLIYLLSLASFATLREMRWFSRRVLSVQKESHVGGLSTVSCWPAKVLSRWC
jgi:hypothetical protein